MCVGVVAILLLNVMDVFSVCGGVFCELCPVCFLVVGKGPSVLL